MVHSPQTSRAGLLSAPARPAGPGIGGLSIPRIGFSFGNFLVIGLVAGAAVPVVWGGITWWGNSSLPLNAAAKSFVSWLNFAGKGY